jgi:hypothetical protein
MTATYVTVAMKRRRPLLRRRQWSVAGVWLAVWAGLAILEGLFVLDADPRGPEFDGLHQADRVSAMVLIAVALVWFLTWLPVLPVSTRLRALSGSRVVLASIGVVWIVWVLLTLHE